LLPAAELRVGVIHQEHVIEATSVGVVAMNGSVGSVVVFLLVVATILLLRGQGDSWPVTLAKLTIGVLLSMVVVVLLGGLIAWWS
jgi:hypothetical protein